MPRVCKDALGAADLDHRSEVENDDPVADGLDDGEVVGDEKVGQSEFCFQVGKEVQHLRLNRDIQGRDRFVENDDSGIGGKRAGDADPLGLTAGEFMRVAVEEFFAQVYAGKDVADAPVALGLCHPVQTLERCLHDLPNGLARVERALRVLKDVLDQLSEGSAGSALSRA